MQVYVLHTLPERHHRIVVQREIRYVRIVIVAAQHLGGVRGIVERRHRHQGRIAEFVQKTEQTRTQRIVVQYQIELECVRIVEQLLDAVRAQGTLARQHAVRPQRVDGLARRLVVTVHQIDVVLLVEQIVHALHVHVRDIWRSARIAIGGQNGQVVTSCGQSVHQCRVPGCIIDQDQLCEYDQMCVGRI